MARTLSAVSTSEQAVHDSVPRPVVQESAPNNRIFIGLALLSVYLIWGSTYLAIRVAIQSLPPFLMAGTRFVIAGTVLFVFLRLRGAPAPARPQWISASIVGSLLLMGGNGGVVFAERYVASGLAALVIATVPLWAALFAGLWGHWPSRREWLGLAIGFGGIVLLNLESDLRANPLAAIILIGAALCWSFGSMWSRRLPLPSGLMASAVQMLAGGLALIGLGVLTREQVPLAPAPESILALIYLIIFGSLVGFSAYTYLLRHVRPALATSYAYVNPVVAVGLGVGLAGEHITEAGLLAMAVIIAGVALVALKRS